MAKTQGALEQSMTLCTSSTVGENVAFYGQNMGKKGLKCFQNVIKSIENPMLQLEGEGGSPRHFYNPPTIPFLDWVRPLPHFGKIFLKKILTMKFDDL